MMQSASATETPTEKHCLKVSEGQEKRTTAQHPSEGLSEPKQALQCVESVQCVGSQGTAGLKRGLKQNDIMGQ